MSSFDTRAKDWDKGNIRVEGAKKIAKAIEEKIALTQEMEVMDFGVGTGLLGFEIAKKVARVFGVDTSAGMIKKLKEKNTPECSIVPICQDILQQPLTHRFDGIVSSMTLHHIEDLDAFFQEMYKLLNEEGFLAIADLEEEDGTFHSDNSGVHHFGFSKEVLTQLLQKYGFKDISIETINTIRKPHGDFNIFLLTAKRASN